ncbi:MAG: ribulose-phosphate 3-epimerase [Hydrotalea sp.]|nr:ribulose-phosphate 3-epimerase [Hydrotalea sp.]
MTNQPIIAPSLLSADFANLAAEVKRLETAGTDWFHFDVMDGHFVKNITFGPPLIKSLRAQSKKFFDVHLMIENYHDYIDAFAAAGSDQITVHCEAPAKQDLATAFKKITALGKKCGIAVKPATALSVVENILPQLDLLIVMSVEPGFGGQGFIPESYAKITEASKLVRGTKTIVEVDGGVNGDNAKSICAAFTVGGAPLNQLSLVAGNYIMGDGRHDQYQSRIATLKNL